MNFPGQKSPDKALPFPSLSTEYPHVESILPPFTTL